MKVDDLVAIDTHTHAEVSCWNPFDNYGEEYDRAADKYFRSSRRPTIDETVAYYRERKVGLGIDASDRVAQQASDARVLTVIFTAILGGMALTLLVAYIVFL